MATKLSVRRNRLTERTRASALGRPNREENPAARIIAGGVGRMPQFIVIIVP